MGLASALLSLHVTILYEIQPLQLWKVGPCIFGRDEDVATTSTGRVPAGNFVVKRSARKFNQVDPDQAQEWINGTGKKGGGIVGITKTTTALSRWALSYNLRSHISVNTHEMYHIYPGEF